MDEYLGLARSQQTKYVRAGEGKLEERRERTIKGMRGRMERGSEEERREGEVFQDAGVPPRLSFWIAGYPPLSQVCSRVGKIQRSELRLRKPAFFRYFSCLASEEFCFRNA